jgi:hypothetical protein
MKKFVLVLLTFTNTRIPKMNANNKRLGFAIAVIALIGLPLAGCGNGTTSVVKYIPVAADYTISGLSQIFDNEPKPVTITAKTGKSGGTVTVYYEGTDGTAYPKSAAAPSAIGKYAVTFDVAAAADWNAATGLSAGTLEINDVSGFTTIAAFGAWLSAQPANTADTAYTVVLNVSDITSLRTTLISATDKYVCLDLSGSTFTSIGEHAFQSCTGLTGITIPDSVTSIGDYAFSRCTGLTEITIPNSVTTIGEWAFQSCTSFTSVTIPDSVITIGRGAYYDCTGLTSVTIPDSVTSIGEGAFSHCGFTSLPTLPNTITSIWDSAFSACTGLTEITIPNSVTSIGEWAFQSCTSLTSVTIPNSVTSIGEMAFYNCTSLTSITIPNSVTSIGHGAFSDCTGLTEITIPDSVTTIVDFAFHECTSLASVTIGSGVTSIGNMAFADCTSLTSITIPDSVTIIGSSAFERTAWLDNQPDGLVYAGKVALKYKGIMPANTSINISDGTKGIAGSAFRHCENLTSVTIPNSVTGIVASAFYNCYGLTAINVDVANTVYSSVDGVLYNKDQTVLHTYPAGKSAVSFIIPNSVTGIGEGAFFDCISLTSVTIPNGVTSIGLFVFYGCISLTSVTFEGTIPSSGISNYADHRVFPGDLREKFYATDADNGTPGTYTRESGSDTWVKG